MLWLVIGQERIPLRQGETTLGRSHYCTVVLDSATASRQHAAIEIRNGEVVLDDLNSRNGTLLNGERISGAEPLRAGDVITIGKIEIQLVSGSLSDEAANTAENEAPSAPENTAVSALETLPDVKGTR